ncbi:MAG TPA: hypothetical protein VF719_04670 [Abditibacteriaceae bacterium]|jgi:hypothetical protein
MVDHELATNRFSSDGRYLGRYSNFVWGNSDNDAKTFFQSVVVDPRGNVLGQLETRRNPNRVQPMAIRAVDVHTWINPKMGYVTTWKFNLPENVTARDILLMAASQSTLFFQYKYETPENWLGPTALARTGPDGKIHKFFDIYSHYKAEFLQAVKNDTGNKTGTFRIGDVLYASHKNVYLEVQNGKTYRIDKITFL